MSNKKIIFLSYRLGYDKLLYWDKILSYLKQEYPKLRVFTAWKPLKTKDGSLETEYKLKGIKYYLNKNKINQKLIFIPFPFFLRDIISYKPEIIILNEFNLANFYVLVFKKLFFKKYKMILLIENDPSIGFKEKNKENFFRKIYRKFFVNNVDLILTNNNLGKNYLLRLGVKSNKIVVKPYLTSFPDKNNIKNNDDIRNKRINILYVGQLIERKGVIYLLKALNNIKNKVKGKVVVNIVGDGVEKKLLIEYKNKTRLDFIQFHGKIPFEKLHKFYNNADIFVLPTLYDYRALVGFEALGYGCAILDSKFDGARYEIVEEGKNGFIFNPINIDEFSKKILYLVENTTILDDYKKYSEKLSKKYTPKQCSENLIYTIKKALNENT